MVNKIHVKGHHLARHWLERTQRQPEGQAVFVFFKSRIQVLMFVDLRPFNLQVFNGRP